MGWFYNPPPPTQTGPPEPPGAVALGNAPPTPIGPGAAYAALRSTWPVESWPAQTGGIVASQLATARASPPQPQPFYGTRPLDALIRSTWPQESWASQVLTGGGIGALTASVFTIPVAIAAVNPAVLALIRQAWLPEQWDAQHAAQIASLFATTTTTPVAYPSPPPSLALGLWPPESWYAQSESGIASGIAQIQLPAVYLPWSTTSRMALLRSGWLPEDWSAQTAVRGAGWISQQQPVAPLPAVIRRIETLLWTPDTWGSQSGMRAASALASVPSPTPYQNSVLAAALRSAWPSEDWRAQTFPPFAGVFVPPIVIPVASPSVLRAIRLWPPEDWPSQAGARYAAWIPPFVTPLPTVIRHPEILLWTPETWAAQSGTRAASILAGPLPPLPYVNRWLSAALRSAWLPEDWPAQTFPDIAGGQSPLAPPLPRAPSQFTISLWPVEFWGAQPGTRDASIFAIPQIIRFMPNVVGELQNVAIAQLQSLFGPVITLQYVFSGAPPLTVVYQSIPPGTEVGAGTPVTLQISLGVQRGPIPCPIVESIVVCNIPVVLSILPPNKTVIH